MSRVILIRESGWQKKEKQIKGDIYVYFKDRLLARVKSLELPWKENAPYVSCIPGGKYTGQRVVSPSFGDVLWIQNVPERWEILMHIMNYIGSPHPDKQKPESLGCIGPGMDYKDITGDDVVEIVDSKKAHWMVLENFDEGEEFDFIIKDMDDFK